MRRLRVKLGDPPVIHTVREGGYRIGEPDAPAPHRVHAAIAPAHPARTHAAARSPSSTPGHRDPRSALPRRPACSTSTRPRPVHQPAQPRQRDRPGIPRGRRLRPPLQRRLAGLLMALAVMAVVSLALGWLIAGRFLRPLRTITATAQDISASNLHRRLGLHGRDDEFTELGGTLDDLFARLEASFEAQRHFIANASHELRTPLTAERDPAPGRAHRPRRRPCRPCGRPAKRCSHSANSRNASSTALLTLASSQRGIDQQTPRPRRHHPHRAPHPRAEAERRGIRLDATLEAARPRRPEPGAKPGDEPRRQRHPTQRARRARRDPHGHPYSRCGPDGRQHRDDRPRRARWSTCSSRSGNSAPNGSTTPKGTDSALPSCAPSPVRTAPHSPPTPALTVASTSR